jgi:hypothetical protein
MDHSLRAALLLAFAALSGCAGAGNFPSLAPRAAERGLPGGMALAPCIDGTPAAPAPATQDSAPPAPDPVLRARVEELRSAARAGDAEFTTILVRARAVVTAAGAAGSESWVAAQEQLSRLQAARDRTASSLSELDGLGLQRSASGGGNEQDRQLVAAAEAEVSELAERQATELNRLSGLLSPP